jgi:hypothetical protein
MTCQKCGRDDGHWLGCIETRRLGGASEDSQGEFCEHKGCGEPKKEWSGKGAKPKYCAAGHKKEK